ncbi:hypothetical protein PG991_004857 [Apiospora marii]|uniref:Uncharacterized protein n=2 Tax=Apiospora marii TaxID=335849 RepID=A0ABR1S7M4_9PEZI
MYVQLTKTMDGYVRTNADRVFYGLASTWDTHWLPPENVYVATDLSPSDQDKVAKQRRHMVRFTAAAALTPTPALSGGGCSNTSSVRLGQATYPKQFWDRHESATLLDFAWQQEGLVELVATLADGLTTGRLVLAWSSYMAPVEGRPNKRQKALKHALLDARSPHWEAVSSTLRGRAGGRVVDRLLRYEVLEGKGALVHRGEGVSRHRARIAGEEVEVTVTVSSPDRQGRWRLWKVEVSCGDSGDSGGGGGGGGNGSGQEAVDETSRIQDLDPPPVKPSLVHAATWKTL